MLKNDNVCGGQTKVIKTNHFDYKNSLLKPESLVPSPACSNREDFEPTLENCFSKSAYPLGHRIQTNLKFGREEIVVPWPVQSFPRCILSVPTNGWNKRADRRRGGSCNRQRFEFPLGQSHATRFPTSNVRDRFLWDVSVNN